MNPDESPFDTPAMEERDQPPTMWDQVLTALALLIVLALFALPFLWLGAAL